MPWCQHPDQRCVAGFWDGQRWLIAQTSDQLMIEDRWIAFRDVVEVAYWNKRIRTVPSPAYQSSGQSRIARGFSITDVRGNFSMLDLGVASLVDVPELELAWKGVVEISRRFIEPLVARRILDQLRAGGEYSMKEVWKFLKLSNHGFSGRFLRSHEWRWSDFDHVVTNPCLDNVSPRGRNGQTRVWARSSPGAKPRIVTGFDVTVPNAVVLETLLPMCAAEFGGMPLNPS
ncbi:hypothetical protein KIH27_04295 [Mycobacterium sp. M1]|uniref:Uncharacterized protein n=1 Tax=Mycolicibacter acidiphilus TaxID=2835306 RepID=A0ABS5REU5_9MYCO|nr:hypothetical protein [Mycolicibacter acidiphilus]MBS9532807.1 hypothetical protein [Mycolicibacter acidiphilus]